MAPQRRRILKPSDLFAKLGAAVTILGSFTVFSSFIAQLSNLTGHQMISCNSGCTFIRYFASPDFPSTAPKHFDEVEFISSSGRQVRENRADSAQFVPDFVTVRNGNSSVYFAQLADIFANPTLMFGTESGLFEFMDGILHTESAPEPVSNAAVCETEEMRDLVHNSLADAPSKKGYLMSLGTWAALLCLHDVAILSGFAASTTRKIRFVALLPQLLAVMFSFLWSMGAASAFIARDGAQACYYEMPSLAALFAVSSPALLQKRFWDDLFLMGCTFIHGDFLVSARYFVAYPTASAALPRKHAFPILPKLVTDKPNHTQSTQVKEVQDCSDKQFTEERLVDAFFIFSSISTLSTVFVVIAFGSYSLFARTMMVGQHGLRDFEEHKTMTQDLLVAVFIFAGLLLTPLFSLFKALGLLRKELQGIARTKIRLDSLGSDSQERKTEIQRIMYKCCLIGIALYPILFGVASAIPVLLSYWEVKQVNAEVACLWGQVGFYYAWMLAVSYEPFATPWHALALALSIKCKRLSGVSPADILELHAKYPQLGLETEAHAAMSMLQQFIEKEGRVVPMVEPNNLFASREVEITGFCEDLSTRVMVRGMDKPVPLQNVIIPFNETELNEALGGSVLTEGRFHLPSEHFDLLEENQQPLVDDQ